MTLSKTTPCHYAKRHFFAECHYAECHHDEWCYAECHGAISRRHLLCIHPVLISDWLITTLSWLARNFMNVAQFMLESYTRIRPEGSSIPFESWRNCKYPFIIPINQQWTWAQHENDLESKVLETFQLNVICHFSLSWWFPIPFVYYKITKTHGLRSQIN